MIYIIKIKRILIGNANSYESQIQHNIFGRGLVGGSRRINEETKTMVMDNICYDLNNFIHCSVYESIIFCWVLHEQEMIDSILSQLDIKNVEVINISLLCTKEALRKRIQKDIDNKLRSRDVLERSIERILLYEKLNTIKIDVSEKIVTDTVNEIMQIK